MYNRSLSSSGIIMGSGDSSCILAGNRMFPYPLICFSFFGLSLFRGNSLSRAASSP